MKAKVIRDRRSDIDREYDDLFNKMVRDAGLSARQRIIVQTYLRNIIRMRIHEIEAAVEMSYLLALIKSEKYGTDPRRSTKLKRVQKAATEELDDVYDRGCINANGIWDDYDGCGLERLQHRLSNLGIEYDCKIKRGCDDYV